MAGDLLLAPGYDALGEALRAPSEVARPEAALGRVVRELRDLAGLSFDEVVSELVTYRSELEPPATGRLDRLSMGLAAGAAFHAGSPDGDVCDAITGLPARGYLLQRCREVGAQAAWMGVEPGQAWALVVLGAAAPTDLFDWLVQRHRLAHALRSCFRAGETLSSVAPNVMIALVAAVGTSDARDNVEVAIGGTGHGAEVWVEPLPADVDRVVILLDELAHTPF